MKLTVLGSGTVVPDGARNSSGYFIETPDVRLMLDCGAGTVHALSRFNVPWEQMTHLFLSHFHIDHIGEFSSLLGAFRNGMKTQRDEPLMLIGPVGIERIIEGLKTTFGETRLTPRFPIELKVLEPNESLRLGNETEIFVSKTVHTPESLAVKIKCRGRVIAYTGDTSYTENLGQFFDQADVLISECSFETPRPDLRHLSVTETAKLAARARVKRLVATHFYFDVDELLLKKQLKQTFTGEITIAYDGLSLEI